MNTRTRVLVLLYLGHRFPAEVADQALRIFQIGKEPGDSGGPLPPPPPTF